ncbi:ArsR family transcriptional regulator [Thermococcus sp. 21S7]|uniref:ArsR/SmtB family transcription factor n=1 Tax=Thermococcus sp. 21S7 TaxID=1638221 RepID=UPI00143B3F3C|nr:ArsR family transcriptional regulator [Thermococcus sp. 21S7]NJE60899.1 ArsR family transcriptional regulator [Thermococcus sp. 21S7]
MDERSSERDIQRISETFKALSSPTRLRILVLCMGEEKTSRELREALGISKPLLISHLRKLLSAGLLEYRVELDKKRMIVRKYYRTRADVPCIEEILRSVKGRPET